MLWFDNDPKTNLSSKIEKACDYFFKKYTEKPDVCLVHPSMNEFEKIEFVETKNGRTFVRTNRAVLPGHLWIGTDDETVDLKPKTEKEKNAE